MTRDIRFNGTIFIMRAKHMAKLRKLQPNIHGGPTHLVGSLGNHTFNNPLASNSHARFGGFVSVRFSRVAGKSRSAKIMIYRGPASGGGRPRGGFATTSPLPLGGSGFFLRPPDSRAGVVAASREERESIRSIADRLVDDISHFCGL